MLCPNCHSLTPTFCGKHKKKAANTCIDCDDEISRQSTRCQPCFFKQRSLDPCPDRPEKRIFDPTPEELKKLIWEKPMVKLAEKWGVSDRAIKKRCRKYDIETPGRGYWQKKRASKK